MVFDASNWVFSKGNHDFFWQSLTTQFIHVDIIHLFFNIVTMILFTQQLRQYASIKRIMMLSACSLVVVGMALMVLAKWGIAYLGISGVIFALFGYRLTMPLKDDKEKLERFSELVGLIGFTLVFPNISWIMHFSGLVTGILFGLLEKSLTIRMKKV